MRNIDGIRLIDATLRDGGLVNDFFFTDECARAIYEANVAAGVDYMEFGYRADKKMFDVNDFGKWKFTTDDDIRSIVGENNTQMKISIMCDVGRCDYKNDFHKKNESPVDLIRVATYIDTIPECIDMIEYAVKQGYEATCNLMAISKCSTSQLVKALDMLSESPAMGVYVVDSYGALYPEQTRKLTTLFYDMLAPAGKLVGIHAHNNQQCGFANTLEAYNNGAKLLDGTAYGMGRGAGNAHMEAVVGYFNGKKYHVEPLLDLVEKHMLGLKEQTVWGYNTSYMLTGLTDNHPRSAIAATKKDETNFREQFCALEYK